MSGKIYVGDVGTILILDCVQDISTATARTIEVRKPDGSTTSWTAAASGTTSITFTSIVSTFDQPGDWRLQAKVVMPSGTWRGESATVSVFAAFA